MALTMPALFVFLEMKDYIPDTWAGRRPVPGPELSASSPFTKPVSEVERERVVGGSFRALNSIHIAHVLCSQILQ